VRESLVGVAGSRRAARRKGDARVADAEVDLPDDVERVEEELEEEEDGGVGGGRKEVQLEAFNLKEERERGHFDEAGNYVERKEEEEEDAWLASGEAKAMDASTRRRIEARRAREAAAETAPPMGAAAAARLQLSCCRLLREGESVAAALRRLGGAAHRPAKRARGAGAGAAPAGDTAPAADAEQAAKDRADFDALTEAASALMDAGDVDVYSRERAWFKAAAAVHIDVSDSDDEGAGEGGVLAAGKGAAAYAGDVEDDDMFADDAGGVDPPKPAAPAAAPAAPAAPTAALAGADADADATDYASWPVKELRRLLAERGGDGAGATEKADLVAAVRAAVAAARPATRAAAPAAAPAAARPPPGVAAPAGYTWDAASGLFVDAASGMRWDAASGLFRSPADGRWYAWGAGGWEERVR
jgi:hypothetical protein